MPVLNTTAPYAAGFLSPHFKRLEIILNLFLVNVTGICCRDKGEGKEAVGY
jgi:hypothetical protein